MDEKEQKAQIVRQFLRERFVPLNELPMCFVCSHPHAGKACSAEGCLCKAFALPNIPGPVHQACDSLYEKLKLYRADRSVSSLQAVVRAAGAVEKLDFQPVFIKHTRAVQVCNKHFHWQGKPTTTECWREFPDDEPLFASRGEAN